MSTFASATIVMTLLTTEIGLEEPFRALRMTFACRQLPTFRTGYALIPSRPRTRFTRQITLGALTSVAVIAERGTRRAYQGIISYKFIQ